MNDNLLLKASAINVPHRHKSQTANLNEQNNPILERIAQIVDEADLEQEITLEPIAPGLDFICRGLRLRSPNDVIALERGYLIFDGIYENLKKE